MSLWILNEAKKYVNDLRGLLSLTKNGTDLEFELGGLDGTTGKNSPVTNRIRTKKHIWVGEAGGEINLTTTTGVKFNVWVYDKDKVGISKTGWITTLYEIPKNCYFRITMANSDDTDIVNIDALSSSLVFSKLILANEELDNYTIQEAKYSIKGNGVQLSTAESIVAPYDDCDTLPKGSIVTYIVGTSSIVSNLPANFSGGTIMTIDYSNIETIGVQAQIAISKFGQLSTRHKFGATWTGWKTYATTQSYDYFSMAMFENIAVIGDSFASGGLYSIEGVTGGSHYNLSWIQILGRKNGINAKNYSKGAATIKSWLEDSEYGLAKALSDTPSNLYYMVMGINESSNAELVGTTEDINDEDYNLNADTFYGNYAKAYIQLKAHAPHAKFIFVKPPITNTAITTAIQNIATKYGVPIIATSDDDYFSSDFYANNKSNSHPVAITYSGMALAYERLTSKCVQENASYFFNYDGLTATT